MFTDLHNLMEGFKFPFNFRVETKRYCLRGDDDAAAVGVFAAVRMKAREANNHPTNATKPMAAIREHPAATTSQPSCRSSHIMAAVLTTKSPKKLLPSQISHLLLPQISVELPRGWGIRGRLAMNWARVRSMCAMDSAESCMQAIDP